MDVRPNEVRCAWQQEAKDGFEEIGADKFFELARMVSEALHYRYVLVMVKNTSPKLFQY